MRHLRTHAEFVACVDIQEEVWGSSFPERIPATLLKVAQRVGGITAGAFDHQDRLAGFVFGITGVERGELVHWSDLLAVRRDARDHGIGRKLKEFQRTTALRLGVRRMYWTFDPLFARNAHLNINRLGAEIAEYVPDMYGPDTGSPLHRGLGSDRFIVTWHLADVPPPPPEPRSLAADAGDTVVLNHVDADGVPAMIEATHTAHERVVRVAIPLAIDRVQATSVPAATWWRSTTRRALRWALEHRYRVTGFYRDPSDDGGYGYYVLTRPRPHAHAHAHPDGEAR